MFVVLFILECYVYRPKYTTSDKIIFDLGNLQQLTYLSKLDMEQNLIKSNDFAKTKTGINLCTKIKKRRALIWGILKLQ